MSLARRNGETVADYIERLYRDPMLVDATDAEIAAVAGLRPDEVRIALGITDAVRFAREQSKWLDWPEGETVGDFIKAAVTHYALAHCAEGACTHPTCLRKKKARAA